MRLYFLLAMAGSLIGCTPPKSEAAARAEILAAGVNAITPKDLGAGVTMASAKADGETVTLAFTGIHASEFELPEFDRELRATICNDPGFRGVIDKEVDIRIELTGAGEQRSVKIEDCA
ncbi:hypothetical protein OVY29_03950 [Sphingopyxis sp. SE2]|uniref:hypothetical protein n=1 Tax=Sphingopyxis sp. SE2 TaxID=1586240 RepID=UPI0028C0D46B|nr:hypothetical protein [Sphingopyxis sp. SE2]MDT7527815.1 hypothetical protein [Sphingopyxis sp. SE2]